MLLNRTRFDSLISNFIRDFSTRGEQEQEQEREMAQYCLYSGKALRPLIVENIFLSLCSNKIKNDTILLNNEILNDFMIAVELLHTASILLDDLPCMDNDKTRRGAKCFHIKYSIKDAKVLANKFILYSIKLVYRHLVKLNGVITLIINIIQDTAIGQYIDLTCKPINIKSTLEKCDMLCLKTSTLFSLSFVFGYLAFKLNDTRENEIDEAKTEITDECNNFIEMGKVFGRLYQISDDFEDYLEDRSKKRVMNNVIALGYSPSSNIFFSSLQEIKIRLNDKKYACYNDFFGNILEILSYKMNNGLVEVLQNI